MPDGALPFTRIAVTAPPQAWFHGIIRSTYELCRRALVDNGATLFEVPVDAFLPPDPGRISDLLEDLRAFRPQLAFGLPYLSQALVCRLPADGDGWRPNLFADILDIPTLGAWDHAPFELADQLLTPHPSSPADSRSGALAMLRRSLGNERLIHWSRDSSQVGRMCAFGLLSPAEPILEMTPALPVTRHVPGEPVAGPQVAFVGHFYQSPPAHADSALNALATNAIAEWLQAGGAMWDALERQLAALPAERRRALKLDPDDSFFWSFVHRVMIHDAHSAHRLHVLGSAGVPVACYSNLRADLPGVPANLRAVPDHIPYGPELDAVLARHPITVDVTSPGFSHTISQKLFRGFDSGGFMLVDRKPDFIRAFGDLGAAISYADGADLAAKIDLYLSKPALRREIGDAMRDRIALDRRLPDVLRRVIDRAAEKAQAPGARPPTEPPVAGTDVLDGIRRPHPFARSRLHRAPDGVRIIAGPKAWRYAAVLKVRGVRLDLGLRVEAGRLAVGMELPGSRAVEDDRFISRSRHAIDVRFDLPANKAATVVFRSASDEPCRLIIERAALHYR